MRPYQQIKHNNKIHTYKHKYLIDYALEHGIQVCNYISGEHTQFGRLGRLFKKINPKFVCKFESNYVFKKNGYKNQISILTSPSSIAPDDIVIGYFHDIYIRNLIKKLPGKKVLMGNHFIRIDKNVDLRGIDAFVNEINLTNNEFIKKYFNLKGVKMIVCPFTFEDRFQVKSKFLTRKNKAIAMGTLSTVKNDPKYRLYIDFYKTAWVQPMRKEIYDHTSECHELIDSYISYIFEDRKEISNSDNCITKIYKKIYNHKTGWQQKQYTSFDMVEKYNEYKMFVCPEELVGMPGIGYVEGMACGVAYIGLDSDMYSCVGLIAGKHYIPYDGTMKDLKKKIVYYQEHEEECAEIAEAGSKFVREHFNQITVAKKFYDDISTL
jgi:glycosyltransferase involved in cell wall biosynthesis